MYEKATKWNNISNIILARFEKAFLRYNVLKLLHLIFRGLLVVNLEFALPFFIHNKKVARKWVSSSPVMRPPGFLKLFPGARFSKFVVTLRGLDNSSPHKLVGCFSNLPGLSRNGPHKTLGFMETQGKAWGKDSQRICGLLDWKSEIDQFRYSTTEHSSYRVRKRSGSLFIFTVAGGSFLRT